MYACESVWQIQSIMHASIMLIAVPHWFLDVELPNHHQSKEQNQIIAFIFITQNFSIKSGEKSKRMELREMQRQRHSSVFFSSHFVFLFMFLFSYFYFFRSVINKPAEQHVAYQWAERLWCWSYKMFLLCIHLFSRCWLHQPYEQRRCCQIYDYVLLWKQKHCISYCVNVMLV